MLINEFRIPMPLSVEEYRIAQRYMIAKKSLEESKKGQVCNMRGCSRSHQYAASTYLRDGCESAGKRMCTYLVCVRNESEISSAL